MNDWITSGPWIEGGMDTEYKYKIEKSTLHITFKGSTSRLDWRQNLRFWIRPYKNMPVTWFAHSGFVSKWKAVEDEILSLITDDIKRVNLYGFSQGGAVAILAHESISFNFPDKYLLTSTFGSPRVVWVWNYRKIKGRFAGVINYQVRQDIIPNLPPFWIGYLHVNSKIKINKWRYFLRFYKAHMSYFE